MLHLSYFCKGKIILLALLIICTSGKNIPDNNDNNSNSKWAIVVHGGAGGKQKPLADGTIPPLKMSEDKKALYEKHLTEVVNLGKKMLVEGADALDVAQAVVVYMENCPLFNAGHGAVMTSDGVHELDAAIMDGSTLKAGAIAGVKDVKNPIKLAREVMVNSPHVFLIGEGASYFAKERGLDIVDNSYFSTPSKLKQYNKFKVDSVQGKPMGTVGCVVLDTKGNLAAATSTGGMSGKKWGRVGDVPVIGAGTYANNNQVAVSGTGHGELWIRRVVAYDIYAQMEYKGLSLKEAAHDVIWNKIDKMEGSGGGVICVDKDGNVVMEFDTGLMHRAWATSNGEWGVGVLAGEEKIFGSDNFNNKAK
ncbi:MAG: isoaspartyl peptidase/L-asparaginase [Bacteroidales bacterium]